MFHLASVFPPVRRFRRLLFTRDQWMLLLAAVNEIFLGVDIYLAHSTSGAIVPREWIPIVFGPFAGVILLAAGVLALRRRQLATLLATLLFLASMVVGLLGAYFHFVRAILPTAPAGQRVTIDLLVWAPPILAPFMFALVGWLGLSAAWQEAPPDSGRLALGRGRFLQLPYSKTRAYFFLVSLGTLATVISSVLDHARTGFVNPWLWLPTAAGVFAVVAAAVLGATASPSRADLLTYTAAMLLLMLVGGVGALLHVNANLIAQGTIVGERFLRGAPFLAPMLFANMGLLGMLVLLEPELA